MKDTIEEIKNIHLLESDIGRKDIIKRDFGFKLSYIK